MNAKEIAKRIPGARRTVRAVRTTYRAMRARVAPTQAQRYDLETFAVLRRVLRPGSNAIDIGANEGVILSEICRLAPRGRHHAIEPLPDLAQRLRRQFPQCVVHECAVAEASAIAEFHVANRSAYSSLEDRPIEVLKGYGLPDPELHSITVRVHTLDELIPADEQIALIKIDVESSEYRVLLGARELLARCRPVVVFEAGFQSGERSREIHELFSVAGLSLTTMRRWLHGQRDFSDADEYVAAAPRDYYWLAH